MKLNQKSIGCKKLKKEVATFIFQETRHHHEHNFWYNKVLRDNGYSVDKFVYPFKSFMEFGNDYLGPTFSLALTVASEHLTTILARIILSDEKWLEGASYDFKKIWYYHALEELEHKAVAFDLYNEIKGGTWLRIYSLLQVFFVFTIFLGQLMVCFLLKEKKIISYRGMKELLIFLKHLGRKSTLFLRSYFSFFRPSFHPDDENDQKLIEIYRKKVNAFCS